MKSFTEFLTERSRIVLRADSPAKNDAEIFKRLDALEKADISADSGSANNKTDILVNIKDEKRAIKVLSDIGVKVKVVRS